MLTFNFDDLPKGEKISGGFTAVKLIATAIKLKLQGYKPDSYSYQAKATGLQACHLQE